MGIITAYPDDAGTTDTDKFLTVDSSGATKLTPAVNLKPYILPDKSITSRMAALSIVGVEGNTLNPIPTTVTDIVASSVTFSCAVASYLDVSLSCRLQTNAGTVADMRLNVDGTDYAFSGTEVRALYQENATANTLHFTSSRKMRVTLAAGSHTIKLRTAASVASSAVAHSPSWWGILVAQP